MKDVFKNILLICLLLVLGQSIMAQVKFRIGIKADMTTYEVYLRPDTTWAIPLNTVASSQLTLRVPTGGFQTGSLNSEKGRWKKSVHVIAPVENPDFDYISFSLESPAVDIPFTDGVEVLLFSFENTGACTGDLEFIDDETDPFVPRNGPNSENVNVGNQIAVAGAGQGVNAYSGAYSNGGDDCQSQVANCGITYNGMNMGTPTTCGASDGFIEIFAQIDQSTLPGLTLQYSIDDGRNWKDENLFTGLVAGSYHIVIRDIASLCIVDVGRISLGGPLAAVILGTDKVNPTCDQADGSITVHARSDNGDTLEYSIDGVNWQAGNTFENLSEGSYTLQVRNKVNGCKKSVGPITLVGCDPIQCLVYYEIDILPDGKYQVYLLSDTTWGYPNNITSNLQVTIKAPTGGLVIENFASDIPNVDFQQTGTYISPSEAPEYDYFTFGLNSPGTDGIAYNNGVKVPLFQFSNGSDCTGDSLILMENDTDPFFPPNSQNGNVGQQLSVLGYGIADVPVCLNENNSAPCQAAQAPCLAEFLLEKLPDDRFQLAMIPDTSWTGADANTNELRITVKVPAGGFDVAGLTSQVPGADFVLAGTYRAPDEAPGFDYLTFEMSNTGSTVIPYQKAEKVALFTFENGGICSGFPIHIMDPATDTFAMPNSLNATVGLDLKVSGYGQEPVPVCYRDSANSDCPTIDIQVDTLFVTIPTNVTTTQCIGNATQLPNGIGSVRVCQDGNFVNVSTTNGDDCIHLEPKGDFHTQDTICIITCDFNISDICDTTIIVICPQVQINPISQICEGENVHITSIGGAGTYTWTPQADLTCSDCPDPVASPLTTTAYTVVADDNAGCRTSAEVTVVVNEAPEVAFTFSGTCSGQATSFLDNSQASDQISNRLWGFGDGDTASGSNPNHVYAADGTYNVTLIVTTENGCVDSVTNPVTVAPSVVAGNAFNYSICEGASVQLTATGGTAFQWSPSTALSASDISDPVASPLNPTTYVVTITDDTGCGRTDTFHVDIKDVIGEYAEFTLCANQDYQISAEQGDSYLWTPSAGLSDPTVANPTINISSSTTYILEISNNSGCGRRDTFHFDVLNAPIILDVLSEDLSSCDTLNGSLKIFATDGSATLEYSIDGGLTWQSGNYFAGLDKGSYDVIVRNTQTGCEVAWPAPVVLTAPLLPDITAIRSISPTACKNADGFITILADGAGTIEYSVDDGQTWTTATTIRGLEAGFYNVWVRAQGTDCAAPYNENPVEVLEPDAPELLVDLEEVSTCNLDAKEITIEISQDIDTFSIAGGGGYRNASINGRILSFEALVFDDTTHYVVDLTGMQGCTVTESFKVVKKDAPEITAGEVADTDCGASNGGFLLNINGGTGPFTFDLLNDTTILLDDQLSADNNFSITELAAGLYQLYLTDAGGCEDDLQVTISALPASFAVATEISPSSCGAKDGRILIVNTQPGQTYEWYDANDTLIARGAIADTLLPGDYRLRVSISPDCFEDKYYTVPESNSPVITVEGQTDMDCSGANTGSITFTIQGSGDYIIEIPQLGIKDTVPANVSITIDSLSGGQFELNAFEGDGKCLVTEIFTIEDYAPVQIVTDLTAPQDCIQPDGAVCLTFSGGFAPYQLIGDFGAILNIPENAQRCVEHLKSGIYNITVVDAQGCEKPYTFELVPDDLPQLDIADLNIKNIVCPQDGDQGAITSATGEQYEVYDTNGNILGMTPLANLPAGDYKVIYRSNGCTAELPVSIDAPADWDIELDIIAESCDGNDGSVTVLVSGANGNYNFDWPDGVENIGSTALDLNSLETYTVTITDRLGCRINVGDIQIPYDCNDCGPVFTQETFQAELTEELVEICLPVENVDLNQMPVQINGALYEGPINTCTVSQVFYDFGTLFSLGDAPYRIESWTYGSGALSAFGFNTLTELVAEMNTVDPFGNWVLNPGAGTITGGRPASNYSPIKVTHIGSSRTLNLGLNEVIINHQSIQLRDTGVFELIVFDDVQRCPDTLAITVRGRDENGGGNGGGGGSTPNVIQDTVNFDTGYGVALSSIVCGWANAALDICEVPANGTLILENNCYSYIPNPQFEGNDQFCVTICDEAQNCQEITVRVNVGVRDLIIYNGFSPNDDGDNDFFYIKNSQYFPDNHLVVFNRWGNKVYEKQGYESRKAAPNDPNSECIGDCWNGEFGGTQLPDGTYYYILKDGTGRTFSGYLQIVR